MTTESETDGGRPRLNAIEFQCLKPGQGCHMEAMRNEAWRGQPNKDEPSTVLSFFEEGRMLRWNRCVNNSNLPRGFVQPDLWAGMGVCRCFDLTTVTCGKQPVYVVAPGRPVKVAPKHIAKDAGTSEVEARVRRRSLEAV